MNACRKAACLGVALFMALAALLVVASCTTPVTGEIQAEWNGFKLSAKLESNGSMTCHISGPIGDGKCLEVTGRAADGSVTTKVTVSVPGSWSLPAGTTSQDMKVVDCPESGDESLAAAASTEIFGGPLVLDLANGGLFKNAVYHFRVHGSPAAAWSDVLPILIGGPGTPVPPNVDVLEFTQLLPETFGARVRAADTEPFVDFAVDWNGRRIADLASGTNALQYAVPNHWSVVESVVGVLDLDTTAQHHSARTRRRTATDPAPSWFAGALTAHP
jgi:hypothetical protein